MGAQTRTSTEVTEDKRGGCVLVRATNAGPERSVAYYIQYRDSERLCAVCRYVSKTRGRGWMDGYTADARRFGLGEIEDGMSMTMGKMR